MKSDPVLIAGYARTPMGSLNGAFASVKAPALGAAAIEAAVIRAGNPAIDQVIMGCVLAAGQGQAPARQAAIGAGISETVPAITVNKMCGSGMAAAIIAHDALMAGSADVVVAGGMESMTNAPYLLTKHRAGVRFGHDAVKDSMLLDGLEDAYQPGKAMGQFAEDAAQAYQIDRAAQDEFAVRSLERALRAQLDGGFAGEITPVNNGRDIVSRDEQPGRAKPEKIPTLKPAFAADGTITAASSASISDGAAALVMTREIFAEKLGLMSQACIIGHATHAQAPALFTTAPIFAMRKLM